MGFKVNIYSESPEYDRLKCRFKNRWTSIYIRKLYLYRMVNWSNETQFTTQNTQFVTVGTWKMKITCADRVSVGLSYDTNLKWHMPIWGEICRAEQKYMPFLGPSPSVISRKKFKEQKHIQFNNTMLRSGFFSRKTRSFWIFSRVHG